MKNFSEKKGKDTLNICFTKFVHPARCLTTFIDPGGWAEESFARSQRVLATGHTLHAVTTSHLYIVTLKPNVIDIFSAITSRKYVIP